MASAAVETERFPLLFRPLDAGRLRLANRLMAPPHASAINDPFGSEEQADSHFGYWKPRGRGRARLGRRDHRLHRQPRAARASTRPASAPSPRACSAVPSSTSGPSATPSCCTPTAPSPRCSSCCREARRWGRPRGRAATSATSSRTWSTGDDAGLAGRRARLLGPPGRGGGHRRRRAARQQRRPPPVVPVAPDQRPHRRLRRQRRQPHADPRSRSSTASAPPSGPASPSACASWSTR